MKVVIPSPTPKCPAYLALTQEGVECQEWICTHENDYGAYFAWHWRKRQPFVVVEWDVIPFPGAIRGLADCPEPWCVHEYPLQPGYLAHSLGIGKYRPTGDPPHEWAETEWKYLDAEVVRICQQRLSPRPCVHTPAVAHARGLRL